jgi:hypothetical protein
MMIFIGIVAALMVANHFSNGNKAIRQVKLDKEVERLKSKPPVEPYSDIGLYLVLIAAALAFVVFCGTP